MLPNKKFIRSRSSRTRSGFSLSLWYEKIQICNEALHERERNELKLGSVGRWGLE